MIRAAGPALVSALAYVAITGVIGRRVIGALETAVASDPGDPLLNAAILAWNATSVPWTDAWLQFPIFHPTPDALVFSEHLLGASVIATPLYWLTGSPLAAYNITLLLSYPLCALAMYALVWRLTRSAPAAFLAGLAFAFAPYRAGQLPHIQVLLTFWSPLALLGLHGFLDSARLGPDAPPQTGTRPAWGWLALFAVSWLLQGASNGYFLVYFSVLVALWAGWFLAARRRWRDAAVVAGAAACAAVPLVPILYRYLVAHRALGLERNLEEIASFGADIAAPLCAPPALTFWGWLRVACAPEGELFAGAALTALCLAGAWRGPAGRRLSADARVATDTNAAPRVRTVARRAALGLAALYVGIALSVLIAGAWRIDVGWFRASASSADKPMTVAFVLLVLALVLSRRFQEAVRRGATETFYLGAAIICWVLSWGPLPRLFGAEALYQAPFAWLMQLPGVGSLRVPARFWMLAVLCLIVFMGITIARLLHGRSRAATAALVGLFACGLLLDGWTTIPAASVPAVSPDAGDLRGRAVLVLPLGDPARDVAAVYRGVTGGWRLVNGFSGYEPVYYEALRTLSQQGEDAVLEALRTLGDLHVIETSSGREYAIPARQMPAADSAPAGRRLDVRDVDASCSPAQAALAIDDDIETAWVCGTQMIDHQFTADLGQLTTVGAVIHAIGSAGAFFPRELAIETSVDGKAWTEAWGGSPAAAVLGAAMQAPRLTRAVLSFPPREARYVRLRQSGRHEINYWSIAELELWSGG